jgi:hypothetical protein
MNVQEKVRWLGGNVEKGSGVGRRCVESSRNLEERVEGPCL